MVVFANQANAIITTKNGELAEKYRYLETFMNQAPPNLDEGKTIRISLEGQLFDSGLINHVLDVIEKHKGGLEFEEFMFPDCRAAGGPVKSRVVLRITAHDDEALEKITASVGSLVEIIDKAEAAMTIMDRKNPVHVQDGTSEKHVLLLGAGMVANSFIEFLGRSKDIRITVVSKIEEEASMAALRAQNGHHVVLDAATDLPKLSELIQGSDLVVSLLPAPMHPLVAMECILHKVDLVTASYESDEMRDLQNRAREAGIVILNEVGLDPGLDHMSAMKIINDIKNRGGKVTRFSSVCGGLPDPVAAATNPLGYKFR
jgi:alpha-aminoadipic semialdehyde synthase